MSSCGESSTLNSVAGKLRWSNPFVLAGRAQSVRSKLIRVVLSPLVVTCVSLDSSAQADESVFFAELPMVASVSRLPQRLADASASVTVIDRDMIKASGARDLNDVFRLVPGFQTFPNNTDAARVTYHGLTNEEFSPRVQVLVDGRSQYSPLFQNGVNWATIPVALEDVERIEVVRGTNAVSYGSNAFLGVINIITVDPALVRGVSISTSQGNQGVSDTTLRAGWQLSETGELRLTYQEKNDSGLTDRFDWKDSFNSKLFNLNATSWLTYRDQLQLSVGHVEATTLRGRLDTSAGPGGVSYLSGGEDPEDPFRDFDQSHTFFHLMWNRNLSEGADLKLSYAYSEDRAAEPFVGKVSNLLFDVDTFGGVGTRHELEATNTFSPFKSTRLVWGVGYRLDSLKSADFLYGRDAVYRRVGRVFGNVEWKPSDWFTGNLGAASERDSLAGHNFSPRVGLNFHLNRENTFRFGASRAYRTGSTLDYVGHRVLMPYATAGGTPIPPGLLYKQEFYGDPDMEQEQIDTVEIGYLGDWKAIRSSLDIRLFRERIPNRMMTISRSLPLSICNVLVPGGPCTEAKGVGYTSAIQDVRIEGVEFQWRWQPFDSTRLALGQAWTEIGSAFLSGVPDDRKYDLQTIRSAPSSSTSFLLMQKLPSGFDFSFAGYWVGPMQWSRYSAVDFYRRFDARLGYPFNLGGTRGELAYVAQSLNGAHGEFKASGEPADRIVELRHWVTLRMDL